MGQICGRTATGKSPSLSPCRISNCRTCSTDSELSSALSALGEVRTPGIVLVTADLKRLKHRGAVSLPVILRTYVDFGVTVFYTPDL